MAANVRILVLNSADDAVLASSPAASASLPVSNLQDQTRSRIWRSTSTATQTLSGDFNSVSDISMFSIVRPNFTDAATLRLRLYSAITQGGSLLYDSTALTFSTIGWAAAFASLWFTPVTARSFSLVITDASNPAGYLQAARLFMGLHFEPLRNMVYGLRLSWGEDSKQERTDGGTLRTDATEPYRRWLFRLGIISDAERTQLMEIARRIGLRKDTFISCFPQVGGLQERDYAGQVKMTRMPDFTHDYLSNFSTDMIFEES